jgi:hypothetical protein
VFGCTTCGCGTAFQAEHAAITRDIGALGLSPGLYRKPGLISGDGQWHYTEGNLVQRPCSSVDATSRQSPRSTAQYGQAAPKRRDSQIEKKSKICPKVPCRETVPIPVDHIPYCDYGTFEGESSIDDCLRVETESGVGGTKPEAEVADDVLLEGGQISPNLARDQARV